MRVGEKDEEAWEVLELVDGVLKETGEVLKKQGKANLGEWVKEKLVETEGDAGRMVVLVSWLLDARAIAKRQGRADGAL